MNKSDSIIEITKAILNVMAEVKGIDKAMKIGTGQNSYNGVSDESVKTIVGESMQKSGLCLVPVGINEDTQLSEWDETSQYGTKRKQSIFTKVTSTYLLIHTSGEFIELVGYGHGVDSQDKSAGKATTYALKYLMLYTFLIPTKKIDDADTVHSDNIETPSKKESTFQSDQKEETNWLTDKGFNAIVDLLKSAVLSDLEKGVSGYEKYLTKGNAMKKDYKTVLQPLAEAAKKKIISLKSNDN